MIKEAAELVVVDMWTQGEFPDIHEPEEWDGDPKCPSILTALSGKMKLFEQRLAAAIEKKQLEAASFRRDFDENIVLDSVYINSFSLKDWLNGHSYYPGDIWEEWEEHQANLYSLVEHEAQFLLKATEEELKQVGYINRLREVVYKQPESTCFESDNVNAAELLSAYKSAILENQRLREKLKQVESGKNLRPEKPLLARERRSLQNIIVALMDCIEGKLSGFKKSTDFKNRTALFEEIASQYKGYDGLSKSNLERKIPEAERQFETQ
jgi:hypothetical protein